MEIAAESEIWFDGLLCWLRCCLLCYEMCRRGLNLASALSPSGYLRPQASESVEGAKMVAQFFQKLGDAPSAIQFLVMSKVWCLCAAAWCCLAAWSDAW